ncbi:MAG: RsmB/NOP family class I SAM-dependent RNA methyltransferase [Clostridiales bacterium]|jgi:16S rRNA C967 or C1407 C5-methylase (RsmB/RsmF family)/NOL1/NOP2/fmu family ribosome biogenesis protein|nr:RsmB/NOP family class I SAM-dependent RNA methyltransferase [Clostridiales bacterium]
MKNEPKLPAGFVSGMSELLGGEAEAFFKSLHSPPFRGLRANRLKIEPEKLRALLPFPLEPVRWCAEGFTFPPEERPGKSWAYRAGLFYIQEPSAMCPAAVLSARQGERVLDLCAAPGGKSAQLAGQLNGSGLLVSNDASASRSRALVKNLEMAGVANGVVLSEQPYRLAERFAGFFDAVLVDAPCSGEGMFRRDPDAVKGWADNKPEACARTQKEILRHAARMVRPGGRLVYSTCTFEPEENEKIIASFLDAHADFYPLPINHERLGVERAGCTPPAAVMEGTPPAAVMAGTPPAAVMEGTPPAAVILSEAKNLPAGSTDAARIWPHKQKGEGHFISLLGRRGESGGAGKAAAFRAAKHSEADIKPFLEFCDAFLQTGALARFPAFISRHERSLFLIPEGLPDLRGLRVARSGLLLGDISAGTGKKSKRETGNFTPSHALAMALNKNDARYSAELSPDGIARYLKGETLTTEDFDIPPKAWVLTCAYGYPLGWVRWVDGRLKNHLPKGWAVS